jgi:hypothetical protein
MIFNFFSHIFNKINKHDNCHVLLENLKVTLLTQIKV